MFVLEQGNTVFLPHNYKLKMCIYNNNLMVQYICYHVKLVNTKVLLDVGVL